MGLINELIEVQHDAFLVLILTFPRIFAVFATSQILNTSIMSRMTRNVVVMMIAIPLYPMNLEYAGTLELTAATFSLYFFKEYAIGFVLGFAVHGLLWAVQAAGNLIDNQRGAAVASAIDPMLGNESSPIGDLFGRAFVLYMFLTPGFFFILSIIYKSYQIVPVTQFVPLMSPEFPELILKMFGFYMKLMFIMAAPIVILMFLAEFALAIISRFDQTIQVFVLAMPIKSGVAVILLTFYLSYLLPQAFSHRSDMGQFMEQIITIFDESRELRDQLKSEGAL